MNKSRPRGPRRGRPDTREAIRLAARDRFTRDGYQAVTLRQVAADAGVDVALVSYYFGSKQGLLGAAMALPANPAEEFGKQLDGDLDTLPERLLERIVTVWDDPESGGPLRALATAATGDANLNRLVGEAVSREIIGRLGEQLGDGPEVRLCVAAFSAQVVGLVYARYVLRLEPMASLSPAEVVAALAPLLHRTLEPGRRATSTESVSPTAAHARQTRGRSAAARADSRRSPT